MERPQQIIPVDQLVTIKYQAVGRCNNYAVLTNIMCPKECKIVGQLLVDHPLSYVLTATADVPAQFWKSVKLVVNTNETIRFMMDRKEITYTIDMFCATLKLPVETPNHPFIAPVTLKFIQPFLKIVGYQGMVNKVSAFYTNNLAQPWQTMFKVFNRCFTSRTSSHDQTKINILQIFHVVINCVHVDYAELYYEWRIFTPNSKRFSRRKMSLCIADLMQKFDSIPKRLEEDYHSIKDDVSLVSCDDRERDEIDEATLLSLALHKTAKIAEEQENVAKVQEKLLEKDVEKIVEGEDEESYASKFADYVFLNDEEDFGTRLDPRSHKENPETIDDDEEEKKDDKKDDDNDDDDNNDHDDHALVRNKVTGSLEELTATVSPTPDTTSQDQNNAKCISSKYKHIPRALHKICRRQGFMIKQMVKKYVTNKEFQNINERVDKVLHEIIPQISSRATNDLIEDKLKRVMADTVIQERYSLQAEVPALISKEFDDHAPNIIKEIFKTHMKNNAITIHPTTSISTASTISTDLQQQLYLKMKRNLQDEADDPELDDAFRKRDHDDHQEDDAPLEGEKRAKIQKMSRGLKSARDEVILEDETPELIEEFQNVDKHVPTIYDHERMEATSRDMMSNQFRDAEEYAYHLEQTKNYMENQIYGNSKERNYVLSLHKIHAIPYPEEDLEEKMNRWVRKEFKTFNEEARLLIQHCKDSWHKRMYKLNQRKVRDNPKEYFSNHMIVEVVRVTTDQQHGLDYMEQIIVMRKKDKSDSFSEADFKYPNKNDIEDMYYLCLNKKVNYRENKLLNSLITFIRTHDPYSIIDKPTTGLIYLNIKEEKRVMYLVEIIKFCVATLERVLKEVKPKIFETEFLKKAHLLGRLDLDIMKTYEREITKRLRHREQMRRWESFMNRIPILPMMRCQ
ncbi:hypothetical protein Tco_1282036 [Tanacetum coccineum]